MSADMQVQSTALALAAPTAVDQVEEIVGRLEAFVTGADLEAFTLRQLGDTDSRAHVLAAAAARYKVGESVLIRVGTARVRIARAMGCLVTEAGDDWRAVADAAGVSANMAARVRSLYRFNEATFERALSDVLGAAQVPNIDRVNRRCVDLTYPRGLTVADSWRDRRDWRDTDWWDERNASAELGEQLAVDAAEALNAGSGMSIRELADVVLGEDPELILALDPPGVEVMRAGLHRLKRRHGADRWPAVFTSSRGSGFTYVAFDAATLGHARAHHAVQRENVLRVLRSYRALRKRLRECRELPDSTPMSSLVPPAEKGEA